MSFCYLLVVTSGSSVDRQSNNVSLFGLIEQVNLRPGTQPPPGGMLPVEVHAYMRLAPQHQGRQFELRTVLASDTGLETFGEALVTKSRAERFRVRTFGLPFPPVVGSYTLHVDFRLLDQEQPLPWQRMGAQWPLEIRTVEPRPAVTH